MKRLLWVGATVIALVAAALVWWVAFAGNEPAEVDLSAAVAGLAAAPTASPTAPADNADEGDEGVVEPSAAPGEVAEPSGAAEEAEDAAADEFDGPGGAASDAHEFGSGEAASDDEFDEPGEVLSAVVGVWTVDTTIDPFDYESAAGSFAGYRVNEELMTIGKNTAVGRTGEVSGFIRLGAGGLEEAEITVDMSNITSDRSHRDSHARQALGTDQFPAATFVLAEPVALPADAVDGAAFSLQAEGELTIKGIANPAVFALDAQLVDDVIVVVGSTEVVFDDYGVQAPLSLSVLSVEDHGIIEFQLLFTR